jgi:hypothetical protein
MYKILYFNNKIKKLGYFKERISKLFTLRKWNAKFEIVRLSIIFKSGNYTLNYKSLNGIVTIDRHDRRLLQYALCL